MYCGEGAGRSPSVPTHFHFSPNATSWSFVQPKNMESMLVALEVSKWETSRDVREPQPSNMRDMLATLVVLKWETSRVVRELQSANMPYMLATLEVFQLETSRAVREPQL